ncbi:hypothetical protein N665_0017s0005 [Sinapis alba]|nr:hypothetical protein N665_0017s0005 [Sinapis alba]
MTLTTSLVTSSSKSRAMVLVYLETRIIQKALHSIIKKGEREKLVSEIQHDLLPGECIKEINSICSAFLWSGPVLNSRKAKISWEVVTRDKCEGGLGLRSLKEVNNVCCLKLVWRIVSGQPSLWTKWIQTYLIKQGNFWSISGATTTGSWMWKKILKFRDKAKDLQQMKVGDGNGTSFWFDSWSPMGRLHELLGPRGCIDMGIPATSTVHKVMSNRRRRRHRLDVLNELETLIEVQREKMTQMHDQSLWKHGSDKFKPTFVTKLTWELTRKHEPPVALWKVIWFKHCTPKYAFLHWVAIHNRLSTANRMLAWNANMNPSCVLCHDPLETREHLFFECAYSSEVWSLLMSGLLQASFTTRWSELMDLSMEASRGLLENFLTRYTIQATIYSLWKERNDRRHGGTPIYYSSSSCKSGGSTSSKSMLSLSPTRKLQTGSRTISMACHKMTYELLVFHRELHSVF